ncbi:hypothetical protein FPV67DRAFT_392568 [Lyophyllum atratum]|nr:hypothetical protein FPV67DRAFT_392568 [Lyophyllum atratum]
MLVTYSAGLELQCVVSGSNSCRLTIHDLPSNAKSDEIAEIFTQRGMNRDDFYILSIKAVDTGRLEAQVITKAQEGRAFAIGLDEIQFRNESLRFDISENTSVESFAFEGGNFLQYIPPPSHLRPLHLVSETIIRDNVCPICRDIVVRPVKLGCQHSYCTVCIQHYFTSAAGARIFPLRFLSNQQYEQVLHVAFSTYMDRHPQNFRYCPTPNCMQVYRVDTKTTMICPSCFVAVCTSCHEAHEGLSCEERRTRKAQEDERHNELWAAMHGVKRCPSCQVWIEKTEGCNHLACLCGAHICWICVKAIPVNKVYKHLGEVHGGAYNGDQNDDRQQALALRNQLDGPDDPVRGPGCGCIIM